MSKKRINSILKEIYWCGYEHTHTESQAIGDAKHQILEHQLNKLPPEKECNLFPEVIDFAIKNNVQEVGMFNAGYNQALSEITKILKKELG